MSKKKKELSRRDFLASATATLLLSMLKRNSFATENSAFKLPPLPYSENALEPYISAKTIKIHYHNHHKKYVAAVTAKAKGTPYEKASLEKIIKDTYGNTTDFEYLHLMAVLAWNHEFYWKSMKPKGGGEIPALVKEKIEKSFGSVDTFKTQFKDAAMTPGSGWAWLVLNGEKLEVKYMKYHESPLTFNVKPIITLDCWEHAYYLDYQDEKEKYIDAFLNNLINWSFAESNLK